MTSKSNKYHSLFYYQTYFLYFQSCQSFTTQILLTHFFPVLRSMTQTLLLKVFRLSCMQRMASAMRLGRDRTAASTLQGLLSRSATCNMASTHTHTEKTNMLLKTPEILIYILLLMLYTWCPKSLHPKRHCSKERKSSRHVPSVQIH